MGATFVILLPFGGRYVHPSWAVALTELQWPTNSSHAYVHSMYIKRDQARNTLVEKALTLDPDFLLWLDDDTQPPKDVVIKLHAALTTAEDDVVACGGIYSSKRIPTEPLVYAYEDSAPFWKWRAGEVFPCKGIGTGCLMMKASVFREIPKPWFRDIDSIEEVGDDPAIKLDPRVGEFHMTDDLYLARKLDQAGKKMIAHGGVLCVHWDQEGNPYTLPRDSYPMKHMKSEPWYNQFGIISNNLLAPELEGVEDELVS